MVRVALQLESVPWTVYSLKFWLTSVAFSLPANFRRGLLRAHGSARCCVARGSGFGCRASLVVVVLVVLLRVALRVAVGLGRPTTAHLTKTA